MAGRRSRRCPRRLLRLARRCRLRGERGSYVVEFAIIFPAFLILMFGGIQTALYFHARNIALSAAQAGVDEGRLKNGSPERADANARQFVSEQGGGVLTDVNVDTGESNAASVRVTVRGQAMSIIPFFSLDVSQTAAGAVERFTVPGQP